MKRILSVTVLLIICCSTLIFRAWAEENGPSWIMTDNNQLKQSIEASIGLVCGTCVIGMLINIAMYGSSQMPVEGDYLKKCGGCQTKRDKHVGST